MFDQLIEFDQHLFLAINQGLANPFFDWLMPLLRNRFFWSPLYLFLSIFLIKNYNKQGWIILLFLGLTFGITDFFNSSIIKPTVQRLRPCNDPEMKPEVEARVACGGGFSFPSTHASNHFAIAMFLITMFYKKWKDIVLLALLWAFSISFAQVYVGVHYPFDVTAGALLGCIIGYLTATTLINFQFKNTWKAGN